MTQALTAYRSALAARQRLALANPTSLRQIEQQISLHRAIGSLHEQAGRLAEARASYENAEAIGERSANLQPSPRTILLELSYVYDSWGDLALRAGDKGQALAKCERTRELALALIRANPSVPEYRSRNADAVRRIGVVLRASGRPGDAISHYRQSLAELERIQKPTPTDLYDMACCCSLISGAATDAGSGMTAAEGRAEAERAVAGVRRAVAAGYYNIPWIREGDSDMAPLRSRRDFRLLMFDLAFPRSPFVSNR
jgi:tetratricopeptide (TPR) repeat protein